MIWCPFYHPRHPLVTFLYLQYYIVHMLQQDYRGAWRKTTHSACEGGVVLQWWCLSKKKNVCSVITASFNVIVIFTQKVVKYIPIKISNSKKGMDHKGQVCPPLPLCSHLHRWECAVHVVVWLASFCFALDFLPCWSSRTDLTITDLVYTTLPFSQFILHFI